MNPITRLTDWIASLRENTDTYPDTVYLRIDYRKTSFSMTMLSRTLRTVGYGGTGAAITLLLTDPTNGFPTATISPWVFVVTSAALVTGAFMGIDIPAYYQIRLPDDDPSPIDEPADIINTTAAIIEEATTVIEEATTILNVPKTAIPPLSTHDTPPTTHDNPPTTHDKDTP